jgi:hypothetical protein
MNETETTTNIHDILSAEADGFECAGCGEEIDGEGTTVTLYPGSFEEPPEYGEICDRCNGYDHEPDSDEGYIHDDPSLDYTYDPYCD